MLRMVGPVSTKSCENAVAPLNKIDNFTTDHICRILPISTISTHEKLALTIDMIFLLRLKIGRHGLIPLWARNILEHTLQNQFSPLSNCGQKCCDPWLVVSRYEFLRKIKKMRGRMDPSVPKKWLKIFGQKCHVSEKDSRGKRVVICHAGCKDSLIPSAHLLCTKDFNKTMVDYSLDMNGNVFDSWFQNTLLSNLPLERVMIMDRTKYHSLLLEKARNS